MAYDPKAYLQQALKSGFQDIYTPASNIDDSPRYEGSEARFGDVVVRPLMELFGQTEQDIGTPQQVGHAVSVPLTGQYAGYFRNDIYDNDGNFVRTTISEPDTDKYGLKSLAQLGLTAASFGGLGPAAQLFSKGVSGIAALKSGDPSRILSAAMNIPGAGNLIPAELKTLMDYAGKAGQVQSALKGDPNAIFSLITGAAKSGATPKGQAASAGYGGADPGFFDPDAETAPLPDWALDPYKDETKAGDYYAGLDNVVNEWDEADTIPDTYDTAPKTSMSPQEMSRFLEANIDDPGTIETLMQDYFPELYRQTITTTGTLPKKDVIIPDWDIMEEPDRTPGSPTDTTPQPPTFDDDRTVGTTPATSGTGRTGGTGGTRSTTPATPPAQSGLDYQKLAYIFGLLGGQRPKEEEQYQAAQWQPLDRELMYGLRG